VRHTYLPLGDELIQSHLSTGTNNSLLHRITTRMDWSLSKTARVSAFVNYNANATKIVKHNNDTSYSTNTEDALIRQENTNSSAGVKNLQASVSYQNRWSSNRSLLVKWDLRNSTGETGSYSSYEYYRYSL